MSLKKFWQSEDAVSETLGAILILAIVFTSICIITTVAYPIIQNSQEQAHIQSIEQSFTVLDSRISKTGLGWSPEQITNVKMDGGTLWIDNSSYLLIKRDNAPTDNISINLSSIVYELNGRTVAWEGGGVWSKYPGGGSVMLAPPEFHYNGETLTLPIMHVIGNSSAGGTGNTNIITRLDGNPAILYPNATGVNRTNPLAGKATNVIVRSEYYDAWVRHIDEMTYCDAVSYPSNKTAHITLLVLPQMGPALNFPPPIDFRGINTSDPTPLDYFYFNLSGVSPSFEMDLRAPGSASDIPSMEPSLLIHLMKAGGGSTAGVRIDVGYSENNKEEWFQTDTPYIAIVGGEADINLLNGSLGTQYKSNDDSWTWGEPIDAPYNGTYTKNDAGPSLEYVIQHYIRIMAEEYGAFELNYGENPGDKHTGFDKDGSTYGLSYEGTDVLTYLYITENTIEISFN